MPIRFAKGQQHLPDLANIATIIVPVDGSEIVKADASACVLILTFFLAVGISNTQKRSTLANGFLPKLSPITSDSVPKEVFLSEKTFVITPSLLNRFQNGQTRYFSEEDNT